VQVINEEKVEEMTDCILRVVPLKLRTSFYKEYGI